MTEALRLFEVADDGALLTLFHGHNGSRQVPRDEWLTAPDKRVRDGTSKRWYQAGFHVFHPDSDPVGFVRSRFRRPRRIAVVKVEVRDVRPKPTNPMRVLLARKMRVPADAKPIYTIDVGSE